MNKKESEFNKVFSAWDILVIAFGAMIGWGWVVSTGNWIEKGGVLGAALGFCLGGVMIFFVGLTYAELTAAMPQCGGEHVFSYRAMGSTGLAGSCLPISSMDRGRMAWRPPRAAMSMPASGKRVASDSMMPLPVAVPRCS